MLLVRFKGEYLPIKTTNNKGDINEYEVYALAKRFNITDEEMKNMSFVSLMNILISTVSDERKGTEDDLRRLFG